MQNTRSGLEKRLARRLVASSRLARIPAGTMRVDVVYLDEEYRDRLD
ncbi:hypothetical protein [Nocardioides sp. B-3]|nr:hypothetical protein [Nocardioides sp. B-3]UUZ59597.1 hypothetical protein LP418_28195 [Nocardioides sp. B-3]